MLVCISKTQIVLKFHLTPKNPNQVKNNKTIPTLGKVKGQERRTKFQFLIKKLFVSHHESIAHLTKHVPSGPQTSDSICPRSNYTLIQLCTELMYRRQSYLLFFEVETRFLVCSPILDSCLSVQKELGKKLFFPKNHRGGIYPPPRPRA